MDQERSERITAIGHPPDFSRLTVSLWAETVQALEELARREACPEQDYLPSVEEVAATIIEHAVLRARIHGDLPALPDDHPF